jgi:pyruvate kinase
MISRFNPPVWMVAFATDEAVCQGLAFSYGVHAVKLEHEPAGWNSLIRDWIREYQVPGKVAMMVAGPSERNPEANHRIEFLRIGEQRGAR